MVEESSFFRRGSNVSDEGIDYFSGNSCYSFLLLVDIWSMLLLAGKRLIFAFLIHLKMFLETTVCFIGWS